MAERYLAGTGRRKSAVALVRLHTGKGEIKINQRELAEYFPVDSWQQQILAPLKLLGQDGKYDISAKVGGGGVPSQADAVSLGIARALLSSNEEWKATLRKEGWLTRDARTKERRKYGLKKARKAPQFSKR